MRFSLLAFALVAFAATAQAQSPSFGLKAGLNTATLFFDDDGAFDEDGIEKQARLGFVGGVTADVPFTPSLGLRTEVLYAQKGFKTSFNFEGTDEAGDFDASQTIQLDYLEVPVLLNVMIPMQNGLEVGVQAGAVPAFKLRAALNCGGEADDDQFCEPEGDAAREEFDSQFKSFDLGGALGLTVGAGPFAVDARYTLGLLNVVDEEELEEDDSVKNGVFSIAAIYRFGR